MNGSAIREPRRGPEPSKGHIYCVACVWLFAVGNFFGWMVIAALEPGGPAYLTGGFLGAWFGTLGAQAALHAIWCVLAPAQWRQRVGVALAAGLAWYTAWALGFALFAAVMPGAAEDLWMVAVIGLLSLPLLMAGIQTPLWVVRIWLGWRVLHREDRSPDAGRAAFGIRHIFIGTGVLGLALTAARLGANLVRAHSNDDFLIPLVIAAVVAAGISTATTLPIVAAALRARRPWIGIFATLTADSGVVVVFFVVIMWIDQTSAPAEAYFAVACLLGSFFGCLIGAMLTVRRLGYRLYWGRGQD